jgi:hypothetical protein
VVGIALDELRSSLAKLLRALGSQVGKNKLSVLVIVENIWTWQHKAFYRNLAVYPFESRIRRDLAKAALEMRSITEK